MSLFRIDICKKIIEIESIHVLPYAICRKFLTQGSPDICIRNTQSEIEELRVEYKKEYKYGGNWDGETEVMLTFQKIANELIDFDIIVLHGAVIAVDGNAYVFSGKSGVGKTTHILKWLKEIPKAYVVNGDKPFIMLSDEPMACGSPWAGKEKMGTNTIVPLKAIVFLERNESNYMQKISCSEAFPLLWQQTYHNSDINKMKKTLQLLKTLCEEVPCYRFLINNYKDDCFQVAYSTLVENNQRDKGENFNDH